MNECPVLTLLLIQGVFPPGSYWNLGLPDSWYGTLEWQYPPDQRMGAYEEEGRAVNHIKGGIITADRIVTVGVCALSKVELYVT